MREYVKPEFVYENFQLNHTIANCSRSGSSGPKRISVGTDEYGNEMVVFNDSLGCNIPYSEDIYEVYCIETGSESAGTFNS